MQLIGTKHYPVRMFSDGMDDFVMDEKTLKTTPGVAGREGIIHKEFVPEGEIINAVYYKGVMERLLNRIRRVRLGMCESGDWFLLQDNALSHNATIVKQFLAQQKVTVLDHSPYSPDLAPADYFLFPKVKSHLKRPLFDSISEIQKAVTSTLNTIAKDEFYKGIQKLYDRQICVQLEGMYVEN